MNELKGKNLRNNQPSGVLNRLKLYTDRGS